MVDILMGSELGDGAFGTFVASRLTALHRYAYVLTGHPQDAEDLVQEALTRTGLAWSRVRSHDNPEGYVRQVMVRLMYNRWRRPVREQLVDELPEHGVPDPAFARVDHDAALDSLLDRLPPRQRAVLVLRYVDGLTETEIARQLGCAPGTVKSQASKALSSLRQHTLAMSRAEAVDERP